MGCLCSKEDKVRSRPRAEAYAGSSLLARNQLARARTPLRRAPSIPPSPTHSFVCWALRTKPWSRGMPGSRSATACAPGPTDSCHCLPDCLGMPMHAAVRSYTRQLQPSQCSQGKRCKHFCEW